MFVGCLAGECEEDREGGDGKLKAAWHTRKLDVHTHFVLRVWEKFSSLAKYIYVEVMVSGERGSLRSDV